MTTYQSGFLNTYLLGYIYSSPREGSSFRECLSLGERHLSGKVSLGKRKLVMRDTIHDRLATAHHTRAVATCRDTKRTTQATTASASARAVRAPVASRAAADPAFIHGNLARASLYPSLPRQNTRSFRSTFRKDKLVRTATAIFPLNVPER